MTTLFVVLAVLDRFINRQPITAWFVSMWTAAATVWVISGGQLW